MHSHDANGTLRVYPATRAVCCGLVMLVAAVISSAQAIKFDDVPDGTVINNRYPGMRFATLANGTRSDAYARASVLAKSSPNVVSVVSPASSVLPFFDRRQGGVEVTFDSPTSQVTIDVRTVLPPEYLGTPQNKPFLQAFDAQGGFLGVVYYPLASNDPSYGTWQTLKIAAPNGNIKSIQLSSQNGNGGVPVYGLFDNLTIGAAADVTRLVTLKLIPPILRPGKLGPRIYKLAVTNKSARSIAAPLQVWQTVPVARLGSTIANPTGTRSGTPYRSYNVAVPAGGTVTLDLPLTGAPSAAFLPGLRIYSGKF